MTVEAYKQQITIGGKEVSGDRSYQPSLNEFLTLMSGVGALKYEKAAKTTVTLVAGAAQSVALSPSVKFEDADGNVITFTKVKAVGFVTPAANAGDIIIGGNGTGDWDTLLKTNGATDKGQLILPPNTIVGFATGDADGWLVDAGDIIEVDGDGTDSVTIVLAGEIT